MQGLKIHVVTFVRIWMNFIVVGNVAALNMAGCMKDGDRKFQLPLSKLNNLNNYR
jgi:hypothetical protein